VLRSYIRILFLYYVRYKVEVAKEYSNESWG
jgi:hypothetical protein